MKVLMWSAIALLGCSVILAQAHRVLRGFKILLRLIRRGCR